MDEFYANGSMKKNGHTGDRFDENGYRITVVQPVKFIIVKDPPPLPEYYENGNLHYNKDTGDIFLP